ncbi:lipopolysaccharide biosynthesis protein RfbH [Amycolatopsis speibonae]|uniref:Lipopolysaccharide biosynthesis protein RfbH n=1 Tax=Amycolatopsis speibonae TaxID=1450224 RepID=A0ABV7NR43_9PSEU
MSELGRQILDQVRSYHTEQRQAATFVPGVTPINPAGAVLDEEDRVALVAAALDLRITSGAIATRFERQFARSMGRRKAYLTNSGSSANLLALSTLTSPRLGDRALRPGDEVITAAAGFPTTVNPILQNGLVPVFVDTELGTYNPTPERIAEAIGPRTKAIMLAHALGNPFAAEEIAKIAEDNDLFLIEDNCDAFGSTYRGKATGTFGDLATVSFYPAHHITTGEGGGVATDNLVLGRVVESMRDWGRDCWCLPGEDDTCHKRFTYQLGTLPLGYDHKYTYSHVGYNLKSTDLQAALGLTQLPKLPAFAEARRHNWRLLRDALEDIPNLLLPSPTPDSDPSWFGFAITVQPDAPFSRLELVRFLDSRRIGTRQFFAGNLTRHPAYEDKPHRVVGDLSTSDIVTERTFWVGVHPVLTPEMVAYLAESLWDFVKNH